AWQDAGVPRNPADLYDALLARAAAVLGTPTPAATRTRLYALLRPRRLAEAPEVRGVLTDLAIGPSYARNHLLSLGGWPDDVVALVRRGLPLTVARRLAREATEVREAALARAEADRAAGAPGTWGQRVGRALERVRLEREAPNVAPEDGWLPAAPAPDPGPGPAGDVWRFPAPAGAAPGGEILHPDVVDAILARYAVPGERLVDLTAGPGTVARVAQRRGLPSWSADVDPGAPFVHRMDATAPRWGDGLRPGCADLVVLHPPTYDAWARDRGDDEVAGPEGYAALLGEMILAAREVAAPGGRLVLIARPARAGGTVRTTVGPLERELEDVGATLTGYHLAVGHRGGEDWHVLVGRVPAP
ncbi:MAG: hypothetical protein RI554_09105, partial [Trueperaceae bacterium]|nr:hypothetical protein [Trueperaceae bacterium]